MNLAATEATNMTLQLLPVLQASGLGATADTAELDYLCGVLAANAASWLDEPKITIGELTDYWNALQACFVQAVVAAATYETMDDVRTEILTLAPTTNLGAAVSNFMMRQTLAAQAQILSAKSFTSRTEVDSYIDLITKSFEPAIEIAADNMDTVVYLSLIALQSAVVNDLSAKAAPLPAIVKAIFPMSMPALTIAQQLYQDPMQVATIVAMNAIKHPLFCPLSLKVLSELSPS